MSGVWGFRECREPEEDKTTGAYHRVLRNITVISIISMVNSSSTSNRTDNDSDIKNNRNSIFFIICC